MRQLSQSRLVPIMSFLLCSWAGNEKWIMFFHFALGRVTSAATCVGNGSWASQTLHHVEEEMSEQTKSSDCFCVPRFSLHVGNDTGISQYRLCVVELSRCSLGSLSQSVDHTVYFTHRCYVHTDTSNHSKFVAFLSYAVGLL